MAAAHAERLDHDTSVHGAAPRDGLVQRRDRPPGRLRSAAHLGQPLAGPGQLAVGLLDRPLRQALAGLPGLGVQLGLELVDRVGQVEGLAGVGVDQLQDLALDRGPLGRRVPQHRGRGRPGRCRRPRPRPSSQALACSSRTACFHRRSLAISSAAPQRRPQRADRVHDPVRHLDRGHLGLDRLLQVGQVDRGPVPEPPPA